MERGVLEAVILHSDRESRVEKVIKVEENSAVGPGENFTSTILKLKSKIVLGSGRVVNKSHILKRAPPFGGQEKLFRKEVKMYTNVLKQMDYLLEELDDTEDPLWCQLIHYEPFTSILFEDLQVKGYKVVDRRKGLDLEHGLLGIRALGRFHSLAKVLEERGIITKDHYEQESIKEEVETMNYPAVQNMIAGIRKWGQEWNDVANKLDMPFEEYFQRIYKSFLEIKESDFKVLNHGDCWSNNILFKYDWRMKPVSVRFIDFQSPYYSSPLMDVSNFLYFGIQPLLRRLCYNSLLENYHNSLILNLDKYGYKGPKPSLDDIYRVMDSLSNIWLYSYASWYPLVIAEPKENPDLSIIVQTKGKQGFRAEIYEDESVKVHLAPDIIHLAQRLTSIRL